MNVMIFVYESLSYMYLSLELNDYEEFPPLYEYYQWRL